MPIETVSQLRDRNQLTLPERVAAALGAKPGDDLLVTFDEKTPGIAQLRLLPRSYAGIAGNLYGNAEERARYIAEERASWDRGVVDSGRASDGTAYLTYEESKRTYRQSDVTPERYKREPKLRWPKCEICGRSIARMVEHRRKHAAKTIDESGVSRDPKQIERSRRRVVKWRAARGSRRRPRTTR